MEIQMIPSCILIVLVKSCLKSYRLMPLFIGLQSVIVKLHYKNA